MVKLAVFSARLVYLTKNVLAFLQQNAGVTIFAVGIEGETNFTELAAVASEPEEQYVYRETNFDALTDLRVPVKELAGDVCFGE